MPLEQEVEADVFVEGIEVRRGTGTRGLRLRTQRIAHGAIRLGQSSAFARIGDDRFERSGEVDEVVERAGAGLEQSWRFRELPPGDGDLVVSVSVDGLAYRERTAFGLEFGVGTEAVVVGRATWVDGAGARTEVTSTYANGLIEHRVPRDVVVGSVYPAVLDPYIGAPTQPVVLAPRAWPGSYGTPVSVFDGTAYRVLYANTLSSINDYLLATVDPDYTTHEQATVVASIPTTCGARDLAFDGTNLRFVCATTSATYIYTIAYDGSVVGTPVTIPSSVVPVSAYPIRSAGGHLFVWAMADAADTANVFGLRVTDIGGVVDTQPFRIATGPGTQTRPVGAFDGTNYIVAYEDNRYTDVPTVDIRATPVGIDGSVAVLDGVPVAVGSTDTEAYPRVFAEGGRVLASYRRTSSFVDSLALVELDSTAAPVGPTAMVTQYPMNNFWAAVFQGTTWHVAHAFGASNLSYRLTTWDPSGSAVAGYTFDTSVPSLLWGDLVHDGARLFLPGNRNFELRAYLLGPTAPIPPDVLRLDTYRPDMVAHDMASDGQRYAMTYYYRGDYSTASTHARLAILGPDGSIVGSPGAMATLSSLANPLEAVVRATAVTSIGGGRFLAVAPNGSSMAIQTVDANGTQTNFVSVTRTVVGPRLSFDGTSTLLFYGGRFASVVTPTGLSGTVYTVSSAAGSKEAITAAANGAVHLAVWVDGRNSATTGRDIYAMRMQANGMLMDPNAIQVSGLAGDETIPEVVATPGGWLIAYRTATGQPEVRAVALDGSTPTPAVPVTIGGTSVTQLALSWGGTRALLVGYHDEGSRLSGVVLGESGIVDEAAVDLGTIRAGSGLGDVASIGHDDFLMSYESFDAAAEFDQLFVRRVWRTVAIGSPCSDSSECGSATCVDGVCCLDACGGGNPDDCAVCSKALGASLDGVCAPRAPGLVCRAALGACDPAESCDGVATACPPDVLRPTTYVCRGVAGVCDVAEYCAGGVDCPADAVRPATDVCRASAGVCDSTERCDGVGVACPADALESTATICRAAVGECDIVEHCDATSRDCPPNLLADDGTACGDGLACSGLEACQGGECVDGTPIGCEDNDFCTANVCVEPGTCTFPAIAGCCVINLQCDDGDICTTDICLNRSCTHAPVASCMDAGVADTGMPDVGMLFDATVDTGATGADGGGLPDDSGVDATTVDAAPADVATDTLAPVRTNAGGCAVARRSEPLASAPIALGIAAAIMLARRRRRRGA